MCKMCFIILGGVEMTRNMDRQTDGWTNKLISIHPP